MTPYQSLTLVGCGALGSALLQGLLKHPGFDQGIFVVTSQESSVTPFLKDTRVSWIPPTASLPQTDVYLLAVKPDVLKGVLPKFAAQGQEDSVVVSVAAAKSLGFYRNYLKEKTILVRLMPNTPCRIGQGIILALDERPGNHRPPLTTLLGVLGSVVWLETDDTLDRLGTLTACGPAFVYYFMECLQMAGIHLGLDPTLTSTLTQDLMLGSLAYLKEKQGTPQELRNEVTSPNGTTAAGLKILSQNQDLEKLLTQTLQASLNRTYEMQDHES